MTTTTTAPAPAAADDEAVKPRSKRKLVIIAAVALVLLAAGGFAAKSMLAPAAPVADPKKELGAVVTVNPITLNLADGRFLKIGLALQLDKAATPVAASGDGATTAATVDSAKALDAAIAILGQRTYNQLLAPGGRAAAQHALDVEVAKRYDGDVLKVYFTEFVMQ